MNILKKVIGVKRINVKNVRRCDRIKTAAVILNTDGEGENIDIKVPGNLEISSKIVDKVKMFTAKLQFACKDSISFEGKFIYMVKLSSKNIMILGSDKRPYPVETTSQKISPDENSSQLVNVTVTYTSPLAIATVI